MSTFHVKNNRNSTLTIDGEGDRWIIDPGVTVQDPNTSINIQMDATNTTIEVRGTLRSNDDNIYTEATGTVVIIAATGRLLGDDAVFSQHFLKVTNRGVIDAADSGLYAGTGGNYLNFGSISADIEAGALVHYGSIDNRAGASIRSQASAVSSDTAANGTTRITNEGLLVGKQFAIEGGDGRELVVNGGTIRGKIDLGGGNDGFDNRGGKIDHDIIGGDGDDVITVSDGASRLIELFGEGSDIVKSSVSYTLGANIEKLTLIGAGNTTGKGNDSGNLLTGNAGNNKLFGQDNNDFLDGKAGNDTLSGGDKPTDQDTFYFKSGYDRDTIIDFQNDLDKLALKGLNGVTSFNDLKNHHASDNAAGDLLITSGQDRLVVEGLTVATLTSNDVFFD